MKTYKNKTAFTLIELLVVITIIGILAGISLPVFSRIQERGNQTKALSNAKQIGLGLKLYASDNGGTYPRDGSPDPETGKEVETLTFSNDAFRLIVPNYVPSENVFYVANSAFVSATPPDENMTGDERVSSGENHFAYISGLTETSNPRAPLVADGFADTSGDVGVYTDTEGAEGGIWKGRKAVVIRVDQSGAIESTNSEFEVVGPRAGTSGSGNIFDLAKWGITDIGILNPEAP